MNYKIVKCWDVGYAIYNKITKGYLGWFGEWDRTERDRELEMVELFDSKKQTLKYLNKISLDQLPKLICMRCYKARDGHRHLIHGKWKIVK